MLPPEVQCVYEIVIDGLTLEAVERATAAGHPRRRRGPGIVQITAGNYGGKLGPHHIRLHDVLDADVTRGLFVIEVCGSHVGAGLKPALRS